MNLRATVNGLAAQALVLTAAGLGMHKWLAHRQAQAIADKANRILDEHEKPPECVPTNFVGSAKNLCKQITSEGGMFGERDDETHVTARMHAPGRLSHRKPVVYFTRKDDGVWWAHDLAENGPR